MSDPSPDPQTDSNGNASRRDFTSEFTGTHPFPVRVFYGDEHLRAYVTDRLGHTAGPGLQLLTNAMEGLLAQSHGVSRADLYDAARRLGVSLAYLINVACQTHAGRFPQRLQELASAAGTAGVDADDRRCLDALKNVVDQVQGVGPQVIVRAAMSHLADSVRPGGPRYGNLVEYVNRALVNTRDGSAAADSTPIRGPGDIGDDGVDLWWIKEGSATIVFQVLVRLSGSRPPVRFALNVAKDLTAASDELRRTGADLAELHRLDPVHVVQPFGPGSVTVPSWRGQVTVAVLAAEWFNGHELHVYADSPRLHVWQDQRMGKDHPLAPEVSDQIWETIIRLCARYTRLTPEGLVPLTTHINAGDFIFRQRTDGAWDIVLIWCRRAPPGAMAEEFIVMSGLMAATRAYGPDRDRTVWWDQPERGLEAVRTGLAQAGFEPSQIEAVLRQAHDRLLATSSDDPQRLPYLVQFDLGDRDQMRRVFRRARTVLAATVQAGTS